MNSSSISWRAWAGAVVAPAAWLLHHQAGSDTNFAHCGAGNSALVFGGAIALGIAVLGGGISLIEWRRTFAAQPLSQTDQARFISTIAVLASSLLALTIIVQILASLIVPPCFR